MLTKTKRVCSYDGKTYIRRALQCDQNTHICELPL